MKKNFLLIATLAGLVSTASAASSPTDSATVVLPTYVVTAPRVQPAEQRINDRLQEFQASARAHAIVPPAPNLPVLRAVHAAKPARSGLPANRILAKS
jgi:hypothetical protein